MKNILITGCAGFIGSSISLELLKNGLFVYGIDNYDTYYDINIKKSNIQRLQEFDNFYFQKSDIRFIDKLHNSMEIDLCIHLAAIPGVIPSIKNKERYHDFNVNGTDKLLKFLNKLSVYKIIFASSSSVYSNSEELFFNETKSEKTPLSPYGKTKLTAENIINTWCKNAKANVINLRFFSVYGPWMRPDLAILKFTSNILNDRPINLFGDGNSYRDYTYIDDITSGVLNAVDYIFSKKNVMQTINLGNGTPIKLLDLVRNIEKELEKKARIKYLPYNKVEMKYTCADLSNSKKKLKYEPRTNITEGLSKFINWYKEHTNFYE